MEKMPDFIPIDHLKANDNLSYFADILGDDRIDQLIYERGERITEFSFIGHSSFDIHPDLLPKNSTNEDGQSITAFYADGRYVESNKSAFHLDLTSTSGATTRQITIEAGTDICLYEKDSMYFTPLTLEEFGKLSLCAGDIDDSQIQRRLNANDDESIFSHPEAIYEMWGELARQRQGKFNTTGTVRHVINKSDDKTVEIRFAQCDKELPHKTICEIDIEHATQMLNLDAEIVYRLELTFESTMNDKQGLKAEKRIVSGCERELVHARLTSHDASGIVTPLDINDDILMRDFQRAIELALQSIN